MSDEHDVFLSHNGVDKVAVEAVAERLRDEAGLHPFLDKWHLVPGEAFIPVLERALERSKTVAVFYGPEGESAWRQEEAQLALVHGAQKRGKRIIPVLLPGARKKDVEGFLNLRTWVDLADSDGFICLIAGITGQTPESVKLHQLHRVRARHEGMGEMIIVRGGVELVRIPPGRFLMGSTESDEMARDRERPQHEVEMESFYLARMPVSNAQYRDYLTANRSVREPEYWGDRRYNQDDQPVVGVSWEEARVYCEWAGLKLPSEAQWEYACRAGTGTRYHSGQGEEDLARVGWYSGNSGGRLHPAGELGPNGFGLYDMHGNIWEWCLDSYGPYTTHPRGADGLRHEPIDAALRVVRGGNYDDDARYARSAYRNRVPPHERWSDVGFRPTRSIR